MSAALTQPASAVGFLVASDSAELREALTRPFDLWRVFLHPQQHSIAYRDDYAGPVRVTGGPGTGKTIVAIHRARHLARRGTRVLLPTYTRTLAESLDHMLDVLGDVPADRVDTSTVGAVAHRVLTELTGSQPQVIDDTDAGRNVARPRPATARPPCPAHS